LIAKTLQVLVRRGVRMAGRAGHHCKSAACRVPLARPGPFPWPSTFRRAAVESVVAEPRRHGNRMIVRRFATAFSFVLPAVVATPRAASVDDLLAQAMRGISTPALAASRCAATSRPRRR